MKVVYSPRYEIPLPGHIWPTSKYRLIADRLRGDPSYVFVEPSPASWDDLALVHTPEYLAKLCDNTLTPDEIATLELPWTAALADGFRLMVGGTIAAAAAALEDGVAAHVGGGLHHAFANHGEGFCPLNDVAVAARALGRRAAIVDLDVHHGNGTAMIFERDASVFTFSMHQQHNYPMWKPRGSLDIGLPDGVHDETYLGELMKALPLVMASKPQCVFYLAGADPYGGDQLGGLRLTRDGLRERDRMVFEAVRASNIPIVVVLAGGYARHVDDTVAIHVATIEEAVKASAVR